MMGLIFCRVVLVGGGDSPSYVAEIKQVECLTIPIVCPIVVAHSPTGGLMVMLPSAPNSTSPSTGLPLGQAAVACSTTPGWQCFSAGAKPAGTVPAAKTMGCAILATVPVMVLNCAVMDRPALAKVRVPTGAGASHGDEVGTRSMVTSASEAADAGGTPKSLRVRPRRRA